MTISLPLHSDVVLNPELTRDWSGRMGVFGDCHPSSGLKGLFSPGPRHFWWIPAKDSTGEGMTSICLGSEALHFLSLCLIFGKILLIVLQPFVHAVQYFNFICLSWADRRRFLKLLWEKLILFATILKSLRGRPLNVWVFLRGTVLPLHSFISKNSQGALGLPSEHKPPRQICVSLLGACVRLWPLLWMLSDTLRL